MKRILAFLAVMAWAIAAQAQPSPTYSGLTVGTNISGTGSYLLGVTQATSVLTVTLPSAVEIGLAYVIGEVAVAAHGFTAWELRSTATDSAIMRSSCARSVRPSRLAIGRTASRIFVSRRIG